MRLKLKALKVLSFHIIYVDHRQEVGAQAPPTFSFSGESVRDQFDEFLYKSKHICSTGGPPQQTNQYSIHHLPPGLKVEQQEVVLIVFRFDECRERKKTLK